MHAAQPAELEFWPAPFAQHPVAATVHIPGSKSMTNRAYVLAALAASPSTITGALRSRDTDLMLAALSGMGTVVKDQQGSTGTGSTTISMEPRPLHGGSVDCGLAGTVMRFVPPVAALARGVVFFDGDPHARIRPMSTMLGALRDLGVRVDGDRLPFEVSGTGAVPGGQVTIDASGSSQFVSGLLLAGARFEQGLTVTHAGGRLPSMPHIDMTVAMLRLAGVRVDVIDGSSWHVHPGPIKGKNWQIEPDLSNATPFLAAAAVTGGRVVIPRWPVSTTQPGDAIRGILTRMGATIDYETTGNTHQLVCTGPREGQLSGITLDMSDIGELTPTVAALAALANSPSELTGIAHLRGHETDRLAALTAQITNLGGQCEELTDGLRITPAPLHGGPWASYADHRMATAGAIIGLRVPGVEVEDIKTTAKTLPGFEGMWAAMLAKKG